MNAQVALHIFIRLLPSIILFVTGFLAFKDERMRTRWADLLFKVGSIRSAQREDQRIRDGIRLPFFIIGGLFLIWPVYYYWHDSYAQKPVEVVPLPSTSPVVPLPSKQGTPVPGATLVPGTAPAAPGTNVAPQPQVAPPVVAPTAPRSTDAVPLPPRPQ